jgi:hypothetical protein
MDVRKKENKKEKETNELFAFHRDNYKFLFLGLIFLALGFILMIGGKSPNPDVFNESIFNTQRLTIAPLLLIAGFSIEFWAILKIRKSK